MLSTVTITFRTHLLCGLPDVVADQAAFFRDLIAEDMLDLRHQEIIGVAVQPTAVNDM